MEELERAVGGAQSRTDRWSRVATVPQAAENADTLEQSRHKWTKVYALLGAQGEAQQDEVFAAVNLYFLRNGASPAGKYEKPIRTAGGTECQSGEVVKVTGRQPGEIRQFLRGRLQDSYVFLKHNPAVKDDEALAAMAENAGVGRDYSWLLADWLGRDCPYFVGAESDIYNKLRTSRIATAQEKRELAQAPVDQVRANAPETKVRAAQQQPFNSDLF